MKFVKYSSLTNLTANTLTWHAMHPEVLGDTTFVVTEKIHGANYMFCTDGENFSCGKRTSHMPEDAGFFGHQSVLAKYKQNFLDTAKALYPNQEVTLYGELFGGSAEGRRPVQREVYYSDELEFAAFDLMVGGSYLGWEELCAFCVQAIIPQPAILAVGVTLNEAAAISNEFESKWSDRENNVCEGVVISPITPVYTSNGDRVAFKNKNAKFLEKHTEKKAIKEPLQLPPEALELLSTLNMYVTKARFNNVVSKMLPEEVVFKNFNNLLKQYVRDIFDEVLREGVVLSPDQIELIRKPLNTSSAVIVREGIKEFQ